jgi:hypothetical protein
LAFDYPITRLPDYSITRLRDFPMSWDIFRQRLGEILHGAAYGRYEYELRQQTGELNDLFLLLCFMEATALPNPATLYLLEVYPYLLEQFHLWHRRMGIEHSPIGSLPCC